MSKIFVFGANRQGIHGKSAALHAFKEYGAIYGKAQGRQGNAYGIVTKELRRGCLPVTLDEVKDNVETFLIYAKAHPELEFLVSPIGCGLAGFIPEQIAPLFIGHPNNVFMPQQFIPFIK